jgi:hypothetical protein
MTTTFNKIFSLKSLVLCGFLFLLPQYVMAASIVVTPGTSTVAVGQSGSFSIDINNDQTPVNTFQFNVTYDPTVVTIKSVVAGSNMSSCNTDVNQSQFPGCNLLFNASQSGTIVVGYYSSSALPQPKDINNNLIPQQMVFISYSVNSGAAPGISPFTVSQAVFDETTTAGITQPTVTSGSVTVGGPIIGNPTHLINKLVPPNNGIHFGGGVMAKPASVSQPVVLHATSVPTTVTVSKLPVRGLTQDSDSDDSTTGNSVNSED